MIALIFLVLQSSVYDVCRKTCDDGQDGTEVFPDHPALISDK